MGVVHQKTDGVCSAPASKLYCTLVDTHITLLLKLQREMLCSRAKNEEVGASPFMPIVDLKRIKPQGRRCTNTIAAFPKPAVTYRLHHYSHKLYIRVLRVLDR